jgi:hypothetical protein
MAETVGRGEASSVARDTVKSLTEIESEVLRPICTQLAANLRWVIKGKKVDGDLGRMVEDWSEGEEIAKEILARHGGDIASVLRAFVELQANIFWRFRGGTWDDNAKRQQDDYFDAKRHIGYLLSERMIEDCILRKSSAEKACLPLLAEEFIPYMVILPVEEFIRIKAYLLWAMDRAWQPIEGGEERDKYYYVVQRVLEYALTPCRRKDEELIAEHLPSVIREHFKHADNAEIRRVMVAKIISDARLNIRYSDDIESYTMRFYEFAKQILSQEEPDGEAAETVLNLMYKSPTIPNMFECLLRCCLCSCVDSTRHVQIRARHNRGDSGGATLDEIKRVFPWIAWASQ